MMHGIFICRNCGKRFFVERDEATIEQWWKMSNGEAGGKTFVIANHICDQYTKGVGEMVGTTSANPLTNAFLLSLH